MGVDLATYRAQIGCFISRRNVSCDDEKRIITTLKERSQVRNVSKALSTTNLKSTRIQVSSSSHTYERIEFGTLLRKSPQGWRLAVHLCPQSEAVCLNLSPKSPHCPHHSPRAVAMFILTLGVLVSYLLINQLLILSGNVELNPGPLGQHSEDPTFTFKNIINALKPVVEWKTLGVQLDISATRIKEIDVNNRGHVAECKHDMIQFWLESDTSCSWKKLIEALNMCDQLVLTERIRSTYCPLYEGATLNKCNDPPLAVGLRTVSPSNAGYKMKPSLNAGLETLPPSNAGLWTSSNAGLGTRPPSNAGLGTRSPFNHHETLPSSNIDTYTGLQYYQPPLHEHDHGLPPITFIQTPPPDIDIVALYLQLNTGRAFNPLCRR